MILVPTGDAVDSVIAELKGYMEPGDFFIEGGNSSLYGHGTTSEGAGHEAGLGFIGVGVSGGEEAVPGNGPSMMAGGTQESYDRVKPILEAVAAKFRMEPCVARCWARAAPGHYVKMVHNGIEYGLMQLIAEAYDFMRARAGHVQRRDLGRISPVD